MSITPERMKSDFNWLKSEFCRYQPLIDHNVTNSDFKARLNATTGLWVSYSLSKMRYTIGWIAYLDGTPISYSMPIQTEVKGNRLIAKINELIPEFNKDARIAIEKERNFLDKENLLATKKQRILDAIPDLKDVSSVSGTSHCLESGSYRCGAKVGLNNAYDHIEISLTGLNEQEAIHILQYFHSQANKYQ